MNEASEVRAQGAEAPQVDKQIKLGEVGEVDLDFHQGMAKVSVSVSALDGFQAGAFATVDGEKLINKLFAAIEAKLPAPLDPIAEGAKAILIAAIKKID